MINENHRITAGRLHVVSNAGSARRNVGNFRENITRTVSGSTGIARTRRCGRTCCAAYNMRVKNGKTRTAAVVTRTVVRTRMPAVERASTAVEGSVSVVGLAAGKPRWGGAHVAALIINNNNIIITIYNQWSQVRRPCV